MENALREYGVHVLVDGQFGSTGKGLFASYLAEQAAVNGIVYDTVVSNAGPNSGHTFYHNGQKVVLKQLPSFAVKTLLIDKTAAPRVVLSAGAIIDPAILAAEAERFPNLRVLVHPNAAVISQAEKDAEKEGSIAAVAGTRSGTGAALANKVLRKPEAIARNALPGCRMPGNVSIGTVSPDFFARNRTRHFAEVSQGFSLGLNSEFYPKVTSRECTVAQALADARIAPQLLSKVYMVARTYPIRVGNVDGFSSGDCYPDQQETTWEALGVEPELTTVTQRVRRVFTFSYQQMYEAVLANRPDYLLINFMNYLDGEGQRDVISKLGQLVIDTGVPFHILTGFGPDNRDVVPF